jgi:hypothetical protein
MDGDPANRVKIFRVAHIPPHLRREWLQHMRNFDKAHARLSFRNCGRLPRHDALGYDRDVAGESGIELPDAL